MDAKDNRRNEIISYVNEKRAVTFQELKERFPNVSDMTLRTDLKVLDEDKKILRVHGGAKSIEEAFGNDDILNNRLIKNTDAKMIIASKALTYIHKNQTIFLDSGSTTTMLAKYLTDQPDTFYTNGLSCAIEMLRLKQARVYVLGGGLNGNSASTTGPEGIRMIERVNFNTALIGVTRYNAQTGFTCESLDDFYIKRKAVERADKIIVLMDSSKIRTEEIGTNTICDLTEVDVVVSDGNLDEEFLAECRKNHVEVI